jgi:flavin reductase (DIM6/NTAB) family NADH-FMN oxidoreductase RutF
MPHSENWAASDAFETIQHGNKPFSLKVPALVVTRGKSGIVNLMMSMWFTPMGAEPSSFIIGMDKKTKTFEFMEETGEFVVAAADESMIDVLVYSGSVSGHDEDKWTASGLTPAKPAKVNVPLVAEALANVEFKIARQIPYDARYVLVVGEVQACHVKKEFFNSGIYLEHANPLLWLGKASGVALGSKTAVNHAAGMGHILTADPNSPLLDKMKARLKS